jgi:hypothetical protein
VVPRDETWWLHPAYRGQPAPPLAGKGMAALPRRWVDSRAPSVPADTPIDAASPYADHARRLQRLTGTRPGPVRGFYVFVTVDEGRFAVGQLRADPVTPVPLFEDRVFPREVAAREVAMRRRARAVRDHQHGSAVS